MNLKVENSMSLTAGAGTRCMSLLSSISKPFLCEREDDWHQRFFLFLEISNFWLTLEK